MPRRGGQRVEIHENFFCAARGMCRAARQGGSAVGGHTTVVMMTWMRSRALALLLYLSSIAKKITRAPYFLV